MKTLIGAVLALALLSTSACAYDGKALATYKGSSYCTRQIDHPQPEVFRITLFKRTAWEKSQDCESIFPGNAKLVRLCKIQRCDSWMQSGGR